MTQDEQLTTEQRTQGALFVLRVLSGEESSEFRRELLRSAPLRTYVASLEPVAEAISDLVPQIRPPATLKTRLMAQIRSLPLESKAEPPQPEEGSSQNPGKPAISVVYGSKGPWLPSGTKGISVKILFIDKPRQRKTLLVKVDPGCSFPSHRHTGPEESILLEGDLQGPGLTLGPGDFQRAEPGSVHETQYSVGGCLLLVNASLGDKMLA